MKRDRPPRVLSIAGSDSGGGAGIQADLKTFCAHGVYGMTAVTAVTAQNTRAVAAIHALPAELVSAQMESVLSDIGADAIKIGMLANAEIVRAVAVSLRRHAGPQTEIPIVLDPVMVAKSGDPLLERDAVEALVEELFPLAMLVTPNLPEAQLLAEVAGRAAKAPSSGDTAGAPASPQDGRADLQHGLLEARSAVAQELARQGPAILLKGGHALTGEAQPTSWIEDILCSASGAEVFRHARVDTGSTHGTGCTLSSAIAARLGSGLEIRAAVAGAIEYLQGALEAAYPIGEGGPGGHGPPNHLYLQGASVD